MGMFDYLRVEMPLPEQPAPPPAGTLFQTKDSPDGNLFLETLILRADGVLVRPGIRYEDHSDPNATGLAGLVGMMTPVEDTSRTKEFTNFHGDLTFYYYISSGECWEYTARFTEGRCTRIWGTYDPPRNKE